MRSFYFAVIFATSAFASFDIDTVKARETTTSSSTSTSSTTTTVTTTTSTVTNTTSATTSSTSSSTSSSTTSSTTSSTSTTTLETIHGQTCLTIERLGASDDTFDMWYPPSGTTATLVAAGCHCAGTCGGTLPSITFSDRDNAAITLTTAMTCSTGTGNTTYRTFSTSDLDRILDPGEGVRFTVGNASTVQMNRVTICVTY